MAAARARRIEHLEDRRKRAYDQITAFSRAGVNAPAELIDAYVIDLLTLADLREPRTTPFKGWRKRAWYRARRPARPRRRPVANNRSRAAAPPTRKRRAAEGDREQPPPEPDPEPEPTTLFGDPLDPLSPSLVATLERFKKARRWQFLTPGERSQVERHLRSGSPAMAVLLGDVFTGAAMRHNENPGCGALWIGPEIAPGTLLVRDRNGFWRVLQFAPDSPVGEVWTCEGSA